MFKCTSAPLKRVGIESIQVMEAVKGFAGVTFKSSAHHVPLSSSWQTRDTNDLNNGLVWLSEHSHFNKSLNLCLNLLCTEFKFPVFRVLTQIPLEKFSASEN